MTDDDPGPLPAPLPAPPWPAPDLHTLRAVVELDLALDTDVRVDEAHAVVSDLADRAFGTGWQAAYGAALEAEGVTDPRRVLDHDHVAEGVLARLHEWMREDEAAPDPPGAEFVWSAYPPGVSPGRERFRRAVRRRRRSAVVAAVHPRRPRVAGRRRRG
ncbi:hypothetical protein SAMN05660359_04206 [Geodermatophilus obscurus]|uniref:Uncharacterized protein n=1 Tax=Geodermatophilus obscurus TaxID=1861 RepID=A0A1I5I214_9ACTN|nr:hypothetical protein [Geodermatophilus obscurus]SFO54071.1 hypothetical protein SAMN05660359_04206 [Geodermatophilus obscurus]